MNESDFATGRHSLHRPKIADNHNNHKVCCKLVRPCRRGAGATDQRRIGRHSLCAVDCLVDGEKPME